MFHNQTTHLPMPMGILYGLWETLGTTPVVESPTGLRIDLDWMTFQKGTPVEDIWHWFETQNPRFIVGDVMQGRRVDDEGNPLSPPNSAAMLQSGLDALIQRGLNFGHCVRAFGETDTDSRYLAAARKLYAKDGELAFDQSAVVSESDDSGAYVMCWRWVDSAEAGIGEHGFAMDDSVYWFDPDDDVSSGLYRVVKVEHPEIVGLANTAGSHADALPDELVLIDLPTVAEWVGLHHKVNFDTEPEDRRNDWIRRYSESQTTECGDCGCRTTRVMGCSDGAKICKRCFDQGAH
ncbi:MAG: hypothetical protein ACYC3W_02250 [Candidatus Nanopelagicales bacterium]